LYLTPTKSHWACDIEADGLLEDATRIWCVCVTNVVTKEEKEFTDAKDFQLWLQPESILVGHNFIAYDLVMLNRFWGTRISPSRVVDTFVLSQLYNPSYRGGHSLEAWGERLRYAKSSHEDFSCYSEQMLKYCRRDTRLAALLFLRLTERMRSVGFTERGAEIEHKAWNIIQNKQRRNGFPFNYKAAMELYADLRSREEKLKNEIYKLWPPRLDIVKQFARGRVKSGTLSKGYLRHQAQYPRLEWTGVGSSYVAYDWVTFDLGSPQQRIEKLLELGWEPTQWNYSKKTKQRTGPKVDVDAINDFAEINGTPELKSLAQWLVVNNRANNINTWLEAYNHKTGAIHGRLWLNSTLRYRHTDPNSANIPAVKMEKDAAGVEHVLRGEPGTWAYECRDLFTCGNPDEFSLVGIDGTGIQNRCLVHHLIKTVGEEAVSAFKDLALSGDIHKHNISVLGLANKAAAKKFYYTLMMGGQGARLAADQAQFGTKMTAAEGKALRDKMIDSIPGFFDLIDRLQDDLERTGRITLCDGTPILVSSPHMVIPYLLQGDESRLMKQSLIYVDEEVRRHRLSEHVLKVADIHDEWQWKVRNEYVQKFIDLALPCFPRAGDSFDYRIPITGDAKVGKTWAETH
jgi:DNA polymerase-1